MTRVLDAMTVEEVANEWRVSKMTVYRWIKEGTLPHFRVGRTIRVDRGDHEEFAKARKRGGEE